MIKNIKHEKRAQIITLSKSNISVKDIVEFTQCSVEIVNRWSGRCEIIYKKRCGRPLIYNQEIQLKLIAFYCQTTPLPGCGRWTLRWAEKHLPENKVIHYTMDNIASHASYALCRLVAKYSKIICPPEKELDSMPKRREWLQSEKKRIVFHYTPFHGSWLNMVEIWFGILNHKCLN